MLFSTHIRRLSLLALSLPAWLPAQETTAEKPAAALIEELVKDSQRHIRPRTARPARDALRLAESAADLLASDVTAYTTRLGDLVTACLREERPDDALFLAEKMRLLGDESGFTRLMLASAQQGREEEARGHLMTVEKNVPRLSGVRRRDAERDVVITRGLLGKEAADMTTLTVLEPDTRLEAETAWLRAGKLPSPPRTPDAVRARLKQEAVSPLAAARFALTALEIALPSLPEHEVKPFADLVGPLCTESHHPGAHHLLLDLARVLWAQEKYRPLARQAISRYLAQAAAYPVQAEWKGPYFADAVPLLLEWGEKDLAAQAARDARATLEKVFIADVPRALAAAARAAHQADMPAQRDQMLIDMLAAGRKHPHPRVAADAAVECCLVHAAVDLPMSDAVYQQLAQILQLESVGTP